LVSAKGGENKDGEFEHIVKSNTEEDAKHKDDTAGIVAGAMSSIIGGDHMNVDQRGSLARNSSTDQGA
jgi:hypothetical protein